MLGKPPTHKARLPVRRGGGSPFVNAFLGEGLGRVGAGSAETEVEWRAGLSDASPNLLPQPLFLTVTSGGSTEMGGVWGSGSSREGLSAVCSVGGTRGHRMPRWEGKAGSAGGSVLPVPK